MSFDSSSFSSLSQFSSTFFCISFISSGIRCLNLPCSFRHSSTGTVFDGFFRLIKTPFSISNNGYILVSYAFFTISIVWFVGVFHPVGQVLSICMYDGPSLASAFLTLLYKSM